MSNKHLFYIPTNRPCIAAIRGYANDVQQLHDHGDSVIFVLIESASGEAEEKNKPIMAEVASSRDFKVLHFTFDLQSAFIDALLKNTTLTNTHQARLRSLLLPSGTAYGAGPNKAALLAAAFQSDTLHRRDSDTVPATYQGRHLYPTEIERQLLGKRLERVMHF